VSRYFLSMAGGNIVALINRGDKVWRVAQSQAPDVPGIILSQEGAVLALREGQAPVRWYSVDDTNNDHWSDAEWVSLDELTTPEQETVHVQ
jgi:hypothetical protein